MEPLLEKIAAYQAAPSLDLAWQLYRTVDNFWGGSEDDIAQALGKLDPELDVVPRPVTLFALRQWFSQRYGPKFLELWNLGQKEEKFDLAKLQYALKHKHTRDIDFQVGLLFEEIKVLDPLITYVNYDTGRPYPREIYAMAKCRKHFDSTAAMMPLLQTVCGPLAPLFKKSDFFEKSWTDFREGTHFFDIIKYNVKKTQSLLAKYDFIGIAYGAGPRTADQDAQLGRLLAEVIVNSVRLDKMIFKREDDLVAMIKSLVIHNLRLGCSETCWLYDIFGNHPDIFMAWMSCPALLDLHCSISRAVLTEFLKHLLE